MSVKAHQRAIYLITLINDYAWHGYAYLLSHRCEALDVFNSFGVEVETQLKRKVKTLRIN